MMCVDERYVKMHFASYVRSVFRKHKMGRGQVADCGDAATLLTVY
jgi:hypothetical protein